MKSFKFVSDPRGIELLADDTRRRIIYLLRAKEYTVSQIASEMNLTPQAIYHHIRKLKDVGLIEVAREERIDHFIETYYRAAAEVFYCSHGEGSAPCGEDDTVKDALKNLGKLGFTSKPDNKTISKLVSISEKISEMGSDPSIEKKVFELEDVDFFAKQTLLEYANILSLSNDEFEKFLELNKEFWRMLRSGKARSSGSRKKK